jgi:hypothetical protein
MKAKTLGAIGVAAAFTGAVMLMIGSNMRGTDASLTDDEVTGLKQTLQLQACFEASAAAVQMGAQFGAYETEQEAQADFTVMAGECETSIGMNVDEANDYVRSLSDKYGDDLEKVIENSADKIERSMAPEQQAPALSQ